MFYTLLIVHISQSRSTANSNEKQNNKKKCEHNVITLTQIINHQYTAQVRFGFCFCGAHAQCHAAERQNKRKTKKNKQNKKKCIEREWNFMFMQINVSGEVWNFVSFYYGEKLLSSVVVVMLDGISIKLRRQFLGRGEEHGERLFCSP